MLQAKRVTNARGVLRLKDSAAMTSIFRGRHAAVSGIHKLRRQLVEAVKVHHLGPGGDAAPSTPADDLARIRPRRCCDSAASSTRHDPPRQAKTQLRGGWSRMTASPPDRSRRPATCTRSRRAAGREVSRQSRSSVSACHANNEVLPAPPRTAFHRAPGARTADLCHRIGAY